MWQKYTSTNCVYKSAPKIQQNILEASTKLLLRSFVTNMEKKFAQIKCRFVTIHFENVLVPQVRVQRLNIISAFMLCKCPFAYKYICKCIQFVCKCNTISIKIFSHKILNFIQIIFLQAIEVNCIAVELISKKSQSFTYELAADQRRHQTHTFVCMLCLHAVLLVLLAFAVAIVTCCMNEGSHEIRLWHVNLSL